MQKIAIAGYGTVGGGVAEILRRNAAKIAESAGEPVELKYILVRRDFHGDPFEKEMVRDFSVIESDPEVTILVETIGGCGAALEYCTRALKAGKSVVTANKQLVAEHGAALMELAREYGAGFLFEASVAGGIPVLHPLSRCLGANALEEVSGILNGTTNYILTQMLENGQSYDAALREAQRLGYAEADPAADVEGLDAGRKICILAGLAFGKNVAPDRISVEGITKITALDAAFAAAGGMKLRLLGRAEPARLAPFEDFKARWFVRTKERRGAVEERLGAVRWLPAQMGWQGGFTEKLPRRALSESGLRLEAVFPVREL